MKQTVKMSRLVGELEKAFRILNAELFDNQLPSPVLTVIPSSRSYAHFVPFPIWDVNGEGKTEINIASGTLDRPLEDIMASLLHECIHLYCFAVTKEQDTSNKNLYHNKVFKREAEAHGLNVAKHDRYGWTVTAPGDRLLELILAHDELQEIKMCRYDPTTIIVPTGKATGATTSFNPVRTNAHHRKYICPRCAASVRATKALNILCMDCNMQMYAI